MMQHDSRGSLLPSGKIERATVTSFQASCTHLVLDHQLTVDGATPQVLLRDLILSWIRLIKSAESNIMFALGRQELSRKDIL
jgi:hypothetical protein